jgi:hypothetical protein
MVHVNGGENIGYCEGVGDIGFTAAPKLACVSLLGVVVGALNAVNLRWLKIRGEPVT